MGVVASQRFESKVYFQKVLPVLTFAFSSSSAATIPLNVETQTQQLKVKPVIANLSASLGATIGQNGCAVDIPCNVGRNDCPQCRN